MDIITVTKDNFEQEHILCGISNHKDCQVSVKSLGWRKDSMTDLSLKKAMYGANA